MSNYFLVTTLNDGSTVKTPPMPLEALLARADADQPRECKSQEIAYLDLLGQEKVWNRRVSEAGVWRDWQVNRDL